MTATVRGIRPGDREGDVNQKGERQYTVTYLVQTDDKNDGPQTARTAYGIPAIGDVYQPGNDYDAGAVVVSKRAIETESPVDWEVEVTYSTDTNGKPDEAMDDNPLNKPADVTYGFQARRILIPGYYNAPGSVSDSADLDLGVVAPNGELFDPQPEMEIAEPVLSISKNMATINGATMMALANCVNISPFFGAMHRQLKMNAPQAQRMYHETIGLYWAVTFQMAYKFDTWDVQILNQGTYHLDAGSPTPFKDAEGNRFIGLLTTAGVALNSSSDDTKGRYITGGAAPTFTRLRVYREIDFNGLGIF